MSYKLAVSNTVAVPVKFEVADGDKVTKFAFTLFAERQLAKEFEAGCKDQNDIPTNERIREKMLSIVTGWKGQNFVLEEDGTPAEFCRGALEVLFDTVGVLDICLKSYIRENGARAKN